MPYVPFSSLLTVEFFIFMSTRTTLIAIVLTVLIGFGFVVASPQQIPATVSKVATTTTATSSEALPASSTPSAKAKTAPIKQSAQESITFKLPTQTYTAQVSGTETVFALMQQLQSEGKIAYTDTNYPSLGVLIESINGQKNGRGMYWFLYINNISSPTGVSSTYVKTGDVVEWRYEKSY